MHEVLHIMILLRTVRTMRFKFYAFSQLFIFWQEPLHQNVVGSDTTLSGWIIKHLHLLFYFSRKCRLST